jgi:hypothetical protein
MIEPRYNNNHPETFNNDQEQPNEQQNTKFESIPEIS